MCVAYSISFSATAIEHLMSRPINTSISQQASINNNYYSFAIVKDQPFMFQSHLIQLLRN